MQQLKYTGYCLAFLALFATMACNKKYHNYEHFIDDGPVVYPGRADSLQALAGNERILLAWAVPSDLNIAQYKVFWNFGTDSLTIPGRKPTASDTVKLFVNSMAQGSYSFTVYSYDKDGHKSVGTHAIGNVYGSIFSSTIFNRPISSLKRDTPAAKLIVAWVGLDAKCIGTEWSYTASDGQKASFFSPIADSTFITSCDVTQPISYRSLFLPEAKAIDTFYTETKTLQ